MMQYLLSFLPIFRYQLFYILKNAAHASFLAIVAPYSRERAFERLKKRAVFYNSKVPDGKAAVGAAPEAALGLIIAQQIDVRLEQDS